MGAKTAVFKLGRKAEIVTKTAKDKEATLLIIDMGLIEREKAWTAQKGTRKRAGSGASPSLWGLLTDE